MNAEQAQQTNRAIHDAIQATAALSDDLEGHVLMGWVTVAEWMDGTGRRWLSRAGAPADVSQTLPDWQAQGYLHHALNTDWPEDDQEDDDADQD